MTRAQTSGWMRDRSGVRLWSRRTTIELRARPGDDERLASSLRAMLGAPVLLVPRGSKFARTLAGLVAAAGVITIVVTFRVKSVLPMYIGTYAFFIGLAAFWLLSSQRAIRSDA
jgi:hypothetical protein